MAATVDAPALLAQRTGRGQSSVIRDLLRLVDRPGMLSLAGGLPAPELLPVDRIGEATRRVLAHAGPRAVQYGPTEGMDELRAVVARRTASLLDDVLITTGSQQAIDLLAHVLLDPGDVVVVEAPGYLGALQSFAAADATVHPVPADGEGLVTDQLEVDLRAGLRPKSVYVVATFQNPSGATLSPARRLHLTALADEFGFVIVEDDPYGELCFTAPAPAPLRSLSSHVVTLGTTSKSIAPGLRVGWALAPSWLMPALVRAKQVADLHTSSLTQLIVADVLGDEAFMDSHLDRLRSTYAARATTLVDALRALLGSRVVLADPQGGMFAWLDLLDGTDTTTLLPRALDAGVAFVPGSAFVTATASDPGAGRHQLRACFTTLSPRELAEAADRLATAILT